MKDNTAAVHVQVPVEVTSSCSTRSAPRSPRSSSSSASPCCWCPTSTSRHPQLQARAPAPRRPAAGEPAGQLHDDRGAGRRGRHHAPREGQGQAGAGDQGRAARPAGAADARDARDARGVRGVRAAMPGGRMPGVPTVRSARRATARRVTSALTPAAQDEWATVVNEVNESNARRPRRRTRARQCRWPWRLAVTCPRQRPPTTPSASTAASAAIVRKALKATVTAGAGGGVAVGAGTRAARRTVERAAATPPHRARTWPRAASAPKGSTPPRQLWGSCISSSQASGGLRAAGCQRGGAPRCRGRAPVALAAAPRPGRRAGRVHGLRRRRGLVAQQHQVAAGVQRQRSGLGVAEPPAAPCAPRLRACARLPC
jgi:hypothetical protein